MPYSYTTITTNAPIATAYGHEPYNQNAVSATPFYTVWSGLRSAYTDFEGYLVGETGADGKFVTTKLPVETLGMDNFGGSKYRMPIPTGTETDTYMMGWRECAPMRGNTAQHTCIYAGYDTSALEYRTTATSTLNVFPVATMFASTTFYTMSYITPTYTGYRSGGGSSFDDDYEGLPQAAVILIVVLAVIAAFWLGVLIFVIVKERRRGRQRKRLRQLYRNKEAPYNEDTLFVPVGFPTPNHQLPSSPYSPSSDALLPPGASSPDPATHNAELQERVRLMEAEMQELKGQLHASHVPAAGPSGT